jgi:hypothetical protein
LVEDVQRRLAGGYRNVLGGGAESRAAIGDRQIVVDRFGDADAGYRVSHLLADLRHLVRGVHGIVAAVVEEIPDVVRLEDLDQTLVFRAVLVDTGKLVARRTECAARGISQTPHGRGALLAGIDHVLGQSPDDAVPSGVELADLVLVLARGFDHTASGGIDDGGDAAGLGIEGVLFDWASHWFSRLEYVNTAKYEPGRIADRRGGGTRLTMGAREGTVARFL